MSVLKRNFNYSLNQQSPVFDDFRMTVKYNKNGEEIITWEKIDYTQVYKANGVVNDWNLNQMLKAGINPDFPIHTTNPTRLEGHDTVESMIEYLDSLGPLGEEITENKNNEN